MGMPSVRLVRLRVDLALVEFGRLEAIQVASAPGIPRSARRISSDFTCTRPSRCIFSTRANSARMSSWRPAMRCCNSSGVTTISRRGSLLAVWPW